MICESSSHGQHLERISTRHETSQPKKDDRLRLNLIDLSLPALIKGSSSSYGPLPKRSKTKLLAPCKCTQHNDQCSRSERTGVWRGIFDSRSQVGRRAHKTCNHKTCRSEQGRAIMPERNKTLATYFLARGSPRSGYACNLSTIEVSFVKTLIQC